jgi:ankyrin repeat protein
MKMKLLLKLLLLVGSVFKAYGQEFEMRRLFDDLYAEQRTIAGKMVGRLFTDQPGLTQEEERELAILKEAAREQAEQLYVDLALLGVNKIAEKGDVSAFGSLRLLKNALLRLEETDSEYKKKRESVLESLNNNIEHDRAIIIGNRYDRITRWLKRGLIGLAIAAAGKYMGLYRLFGRRRNPRGGGNGVGSRPGSIPPGQPLIFAPAPRVAWVGGGSQPTVFSMGSGVPSTGYSIQSVVEGMKHGTLTGDDLRNLIVRFPHILGETYDGLTLLHWAVYWLMRGKRSEQRVEYVGILAHNNRFINKGDESSARVTNFDNGALSLNLDNKIVQFVIDWKSPIGSGGTPLHLAMYMMDNLQEDFEAIQILLREGADIKALDAMGRTPLKVVFGRLKEFEKICSSIKRWNNYVQEVRNKLRDAETGLLRLFGRLFCETGSEDEDIKKFIARMLYEAVIKGNESFVQGIFEFGPMIFKNDYSSVINSVYAEKTLLMWALEKGYSRIAVYLINEGVALTDFAQGYSLLHHAVKMKDINLVRALAGAEVDINKKDALNRTALVWAVEEGKACIEIIKVLIDSGAEVNDLVRPALEAALYLDRNNGQIEIMKILIDAKADVNAMQGELLKKALKLNTKEPALLLLRAGAQLVPYKRYLDMVGLREKDLNNGNNLQEDEMIALKNQLHYVVGNDLIEAIILRDHDKLDKGLFVRSGVLCGLEPVEESETESDEDITKKNKDIKGLMKELGVSTDAPQDWSFKNIVKQLLDFKGVLGLKKKKSDESDEDVRSELAERLAAFEARRKQNNKEIIREIGARIAGLGVWGFGKLEKYAEKKMVGYEENATRAWRFKNAVKRLAAQGVSVCGKVKSYIEKKAESYTNKKSYTDTDAKGWTLRMWAAAQGNNRAFSIIEESPGHENFDNRYSQMESLPSGHSDNQEAGPSSQSGRNQAVAQGPYTKALYCKNYEAIERSMNFYGEEGIAAQKQSSDLIKSYARQYTFLEKIKAEYDEIKRYQKKTC